MLGFNIANYRYLKSAAKYSDPAAQAFAHRLFFATDRQTVGATSSIKYSIQAPADKYLILYSRSITVRENTFFVDVTVGADFTAGTSLTTYSAVIGNGLNGASESSITRNPTSISGGEEVAQEMIPGSTTRGNRVALGLSGIDEGITIFKPGTSIIYSIENQLSDESVVVLKLVFAEIADKKIV